MCKEYNYVAIGGLVGGNAEYSSKYWRYFPWFIKTAHENGAKIHALGFTSLRGMAQYHFDSVDSTTWKSGGVSDSCTYSKMARLRQSRRKTKEPSTKK